MAKVESDHDKLIRIETTCEFTRENIEKKFDEIKDVLEKQNDFLKNGLSTKIAFQIKNGVNSGKTILGTSPEMRDQVNKWLLRLLFYGIGGKELIDLIMK